MHGHRDLNGCPPASLPAAFHHRLIDLTGIRIVCHLPRIRLEREPHFAQRLIRSERLAQMSQMRSVVELYYSSFAVAVNAEPANAARVQLEGDIVPADLQTKPPADCRIA